MPLSRVLHCLICDEARREVYKKNTLLGFFGVTPDVEIRLREFNTPIPVLTFLLIIDRGSTGTVQVRCEISPQGENPIISSGDVSIQNMEPQNRRNLILTFNGISFPHAGTYVLRLFADGALRYETTFEIAQGNPEDFIAR